MAYDRFNVGNNNMNSYERNYRPNNKGRSVAGSKSNVTKMYKPARPVNLNDQISIRTGSVDNNASKYIEHYRFRDNFAKSYMLNSSLVRMIAQVYLLTPTDYRNFSSLITNNVPFPMNFLIMRPHMEYDTLRIVKMKAGTDTGECIITNTHMHAGQSSDLKKLQFHYNYNIMVAITNNKNIWVEHNAFVDKYNRGGGIKPYSTDPSIYNVKEDIYGDGSIIVVALPRYENDLPDPLSITGKFSYADLNLNNLEENKSNHYSTSPYYNRIFNWSEGSIGEDYDDSNIEYVGKRIGANRILYNGVTRYRTPNTGEFTTYSASTGHWKTKNIYPQCLDAKTGEEDFRSNSIYDNYLNV